MGSPQPICNVCGKKPAAVWCPYCGKTLCPACYGDLADVRGCCTLPHVGAHYILPVLLEPPPEPSIENTPDLGSDCNEESPKGARLE